jgi:ABC-type Fe2+-enterobactin transport system substrate-binding protein
MKTELEEKADRTIDEFDKWFQGGQNAPLTPPEKAIVKTFFWYLERGGKLKKEEA